MGYGMGPGTNGLNTYFPIPVSSPVMCVWAIRSDVKHTLGPDVICPPKAKIILENKVANVVALRLIHLIPFKVFSSFSRAQCEF